MAFYPTVPIQTLLPMPGYPSLLSPLGSLIRQLGQQTRISPQGIVQLNTPLIQAIVSYKSQAVPLLGNFLQQQVFEINQNRPQKLPQVIEALYTADQLLEAGVVEAGELYGITSALNTHPNPILQIYLAGFYRKLNRPEAFGPMLSSLVHQAQTQYYQPLPMLNPSEEVGGTVLSMIAKASAQETVKQLLPYLSPRPV